MAQEYSPNIRVNAIAPGFFLTNQNRFLLTDEKTGELTARGQVDHRPHADAALRGARGPARRGALAAVAGVGLRHRDAWCRSTAGSRRSAGCRTSMSDGGTVPAVISGVRGPVPRGRRHPAHRGRGARGRAARRQAGAGDHPGRHAHDADAVDVRRLRGVARPARGGPGLPRRPRHAPADDRRAAVGAGRAARWSTGEAGARTIYNHRWELPETFATLGTITAKEIEELTGGLMSRGRPGDDQPSRARLRPDPDLRPGVPARSGRLLGRQQVLRAGHRRTRRSSTSRTGSAR